MAVIGIEGISIRAVHGVYKAEHTAGNDFLVDVYLTCAIAKAATTDSLSDTIDYAAIYKIVLDEMAGKVHLLETLVQKIGQKLLDYNPDIQRVKLKITKLSPLYMPQCRHTFVEEEYIKSS
jgi:7,8-dihydroneopterin aldolase/epimerase/oxygenase